LQTETSYPYLQERIQKFPDKGDAGNGVGPEEILLKQAFDYLKGKVDGIIDSIEGQPHISKQKKQDRIKDELSKVRDKVLALKLICSN
jgi:hypothetical protein